MIKALYIFAFALLFCGLLYHFAALRVFNYLVPKSTNSELIAKAVSYGQNERQRLDIYRPKQSAAKLPVLIFVHGGSWKDGEGRDYEFVGRSFASKGYLTLVINYRLLPQNAYPDFVADVAHAVSWANKHAAEFDGDGSRVFLVGHSAGGYNIAMAALRKDFLIAANADQNTIKGVALIAAPLDFLPLDTPITIATFSQVPDLASTQPINFAHTGAPPFLLLHGTADKTVFPKNSRNMVQRLNQFGARSKLIEYEEVSHVGILLALAKPFQQKTPVLKDIVDFFQAL